MAGIANTLEGVQAGALYVYAERGEPATPGETWFAIVDHVNEYGPDAHEGRIVAARGHGITSRFGGGFARPVVIETGELLECIGSHGFTCKRCGDPAPAGVGYVDHGASALESALIDRCGCGYSQRAR